MRRSVRTAQYSLRPCISAMKSSAFMSRAAVQRSSGAITPWRTLSMSAHPTSGTPPGEADPQESARSRMPFSEPPKAARTAKRATALLLSRLDLRPRSRGRDAGC